MTLDESEFTDFCSSNTDSFGKAEMGFSNAQATSQEIHNHDNGSSETQSMGACNIGGINERSFGSDHSDSDENIDQSVEFDASESSDKEWNAILDSLDTKGDESDSDNDIELDTDSDSTEQLRETLAAWSVRFGVTARAFTALLTLLSVYFPFLPKGSRTVMKTPRNIDLRAVGNGSYYHFGIVTMLTTIV